METRPFKVEIHLTDSVHGQGRILKVKVLFSTDLFTLADSPSSLSFRLSPGSYIDGQPNETNLE